MRSEAVVAGIVRNAPSLAEQAYQILVYKIIRLQLAPSSVVNERQLMIDLNIGRTPIREALYRLAGEGLVVHLPNRGMFIADINATSVRHIYEFRNLVDCHAAELAAERASATDIQQFSAIVEEMTEAAQSQDIDRYVELDLQFYHTLAGASENIFLKEVIPRIFNLHLRLWFYIAVKRGGWRETLLAHLRMVQAVSHGIAARNATAAAAAMRKYILERHDEMRNVL
jgi:DNA-binding GntR family transcriptional regulator